MGKLTDVEIKRAKEPGKLSDTHGLYLMIAPNAQTCGATTTVLAANIGPWRLVSTLPSVWLKPGASTKMRVVCSMKT